MWQVKWNPDISKKFNFYSISSDGRVMNWSLMKNKLEPEEIFKLKETNYQLERRIKAMFDYNSASIDMHLSENNEG